MASEIIVQTLKGPTSGANANKVIIPSGQTLDANSGDFRPPAGSVIQTVSLSNTQVGRTATSNTSFVATNLAKSITPKYANSKIIIRAATTGNNNSNSPHHLVYTIFRTISGGSATNLRVATGSSNDWGIGQVYGAQSRVQVPLIAEIVDAPNTTSSVEYRVYIRCHTGGPVELPATTTEHCEMILQEIAQ
jgi:hypothetical protein